MSKSVTPRATTSQEGKLRQFELLARVSSVINSTLEPKEVLNRVIANPTTGCCQIRDLQVDRDPSWGNNGGSIDCGER